MQSHDTHVDPTLAGGPVRPGETDPETASRATPPSPQAPEPRKELWLSDARAAVEAQVRAHPYTSVFAAAGAGYVLGAGIPKWAMRSLITAGIRMVIGQAVASAITPDTPASSNSNPNPNPGATS